MKSDLDQAISQVGVIHDAIERSQSKWEGISRMLIAYGCLGIVLNLSDFYIGYSPSSGDFLIPIIVAKGILYVGLFVYFVFLYRKEKGTADKYYLACLKLFGFIVFAFQFSFYFIVVFEQSQALEYKSENMLLMADQAQIANILLFCLCTIVCGLIRNRRGMTLVPVLVLLLFLLLSVPLRNSGFSVPALSSTKLNKPICTYVALYYYLVTSVGYIVIGLLLKGQRRQPNANQ